MIKYPELTTVYLSAGNMCNSQLKLEQITLDHWELLEVNKIKCFTQKHSITSRIYCNIFLISPF